VSPITIIIRRMDDYGVGSLPAWLVDAAAAVLADIQGDEPIAGLKVGVRDHAGIDGVVLYMYEQGVEGGGAGKSVQRGLKRAELLLRVAEVLQDVLHETTAGWSQARPACPYHTHPAVPAAHNGEAWWLCPQRGEPLWPIGSWQPPRRRRRRHGHETRRSV
jgi:hypothetical protein